jgi:hypothetical protein
MRNLKELYQIVIDNFYKYPLLSGICRKMAQIYFDRLITIEEYRLLENDFKKRVPKWYSKFYWNKFFVYSGGYGYWWTLDNLGDEQRIKYLNHIVKKL